MENLKVIVISFLIIFFITWYIRRVQKFTLEEYNEKHKKKFKTYEDFKEHLDKEKEKQLLNEEKKTNKEKFTYKLDKPLSDEDYELAEGVLDEAKKNKGGVLPKWYLLGEKPPATWANKFGSNKQDLGNMPDGLQKWFRKFMKGQSFDEDDVDALAQQKKESSTDLSASLKRLKKMYNNGNLSKAEFEKAKNKLLK